MILSLCSGVGSLDYAVERLTGERVALYAESAYGPALVMAKRYPKARNLGDMAEVDWAQVAADNPQLSIIVAGFPCQDISKAGPRGGIDGRRSGVWGYVAEAIRHIRPNHVFLENVAGIRTRGLDRVTGDLAALGYDAQWHCVRASASGAPHHRDRWFAYAVPSRRSGI